MSVQARMFPELEPFIGLRLTHAEYVRDVAVLYFGDGSRLELADVLALADDPNRCPSCGRLVGAAERALRVEAGKTPRPWERESQRPAGVPAGTFPTGYGE